MSQAILQIMKALVVDDDDLIRSNVAEVLSSEGWEVTEAESAEQALELLHRDPWSLVFCDVRLSAKNNHEGYEVLRRFTDERPEAQIILMTGHGSAVGALDAVASGAYDYLMKPFEIEDIKRISQAVRRGIEKRSGGREVQRSTLARFLGSCSTGISARNVKPVSSVEV